MKTVVMEEQKLGSEPISKLLFKMSVPMILAMVINGMYYLADAIFVGWGVGSEALEFFRDQYYKGRRER